MKTNTAATATPANVTAVLNDGFRVWFENCGNEPQWASSPDGDYSEVRPWSDNDTEELADWQENPY